MEPILLAGPEIGSVIGPWEGLKDILIKNDPKQLVEPLKAKDKPGNGNHWNAGPHIQFGVTNVLCEGSGQWTSKQMSLDAGAVLMKSIAEYYEGTKASAKDKPPVGD